MTLKGILREHHDEESIDEQMKKEWPHLGTATGALVWSLDGRILGSASGGLNIRLWDGETISFLRTLQAHSEPIRSLTWSPNGRFIASGSYDETIRIWDVKNGEPVTVLEGHRDLISNEAPPLMPSSA